MVYWIQTIASWWTISYFFSKDIACLPQNVTSTFCACRWEEKLQTTHLPEMVFGESCLILKHVKSGIKLHFNAFDALCGWKLEALPPVEVPAAALWKFRWYVFSSIHLWLCIQPFYYAARYVPYAAIISYVFGESAYWSYPYPVSMSLALTTFILEIWGIVCC